MVSYKLSFDSLLQKPTVHPLRATQAWPTSPYTGEAYASPGIWLLREKPSPAGEGGPEGAGCGGDQVRFIRLPGKTLHPTSVSPKGLTPC